MQETKHTATPGYVCVVQANFCWFWSQVPAKQMRTHDSSQTASWFWKSKLKQQGVFYSMLIPQKALKCNTQYAALMAMIAGYLHCSGKYFSRLSRIPSAQHKREPGVHSDKFSTSNIIQRRGKLPHRRPVMFSALRCCLPLVSVTCVSCVGSTHWCVCVCVLCVHACMQACVRIVSPDKIL